MDFLTRQLSFQAYGLWRDPRRRRPMPFTAITFHERETDEVLFVPAPEDTITASLTSNDAIVENSGPTGSLSPFASFDILLACCSSSNDRAGGNGDDGGQQ